MFCCSAPSCEISLKSLWTFAKDVEKVSRELSRVQSSWVESSHWLVSGYSGPWGVAIRGCIYILSIHVMWRHYKNCDPPPPQSNPSSYFVLYFSKKLPWIFYSLLVFVCNAEREKQAEVYFLWTSLGATLRIHLYSLKFQTKLYFAGFQ